MSQPSKDAQKCAGTYVEDVKRTMPSVAEWLQIECRAGALKEAVVAFAGSQQEILNPHLVLVEKVGADTIECVIPCRLADHESRGTFASEVRFTLNPKTGEATRLLLPV